VWLVHGDWSEPALKQMTGPPATRIDEVGLSAMRFSQGTAHEVRLLRVQNQMQVVGWA